MSQPIDRIILASASPRRAELLSAAGIDFEIQPADVDETVGAGESPAEYVSRLAEAKGRLVYERDSSRTVIAADTAVVVDGHILGKPLDDADAVRMLRMLIGRKHDVLTAVSVFHPGGIVDTRIDTTTVEFLPLSDADIHWYVASGEPMDKAGAYAVQGRVAMHINRINGSYSGIMGLPLRETAQLLHAAGLRF